MFVRRLWLPVASLAGLAGLDALFRIFHPHATHSDQVRDATKVLSLVVYFGVLAFQIWLAERVLVTIFRKQGREAWRFMVNDANVEKIRDHFIICGYGQVGRMIGKYSGA